MSDIRENPPIYYSQVNKTAEKFMETCYSPSDMSNSEIGKYSAVVNGRRQDEPFGVIIDADGDEIEVLSSGRRLRTKIKGGKAAIYNIPPTKDGAEYLILRSGVVVSHGKLYPTGKLRMIRSGGKPFNIRDLGGKKCDGGETKYGIIYRGAELNGDYFHVTVTDADREVLCGFLGINCELDLRGDKETYGITSSVLGERVKYEHYPVGAYADGVRLDGEFAKLYGTLLESTISHSLAGDVTYIHCMLGGDRTGTFCAILEGLLGVDRSDIDKDYELTSLAGGPRQRNSDNWRGFMEYMNSLDGDCFRDKCVSWALALGVDKDKINAFRRIMTDSI